MNKYLHYKGFSVFLQMKVASVAIFVDNDNNNQREMKLSSPASWQGLDIHTNTHAFIVCQVSP